MKYPYKDLLTIMLISLFILNSCKNPSGVGLDVEPGSEISAQLSSIDLQAVTMRDDSAINDGSARQIAFGYLNDPIIGESQSDLAFNIGSAGDGVDPRIPANATIDSAVLILRYGSAGFYGDSLNSHFQLALKQLDEVFTPGMPTTKEWMTATNTIASVSLSKFNVKDSINITKTVDGKDTVLRVPPQLRIRLSNDFIKELLKSDADSATMVNQGTFMNYVKGFYLSVDKEAQTGLGGFAHFNLNPGGTDAFGNTDDYNGLEVYYKTPATGEDDTPDTVALRFAMNSTYAAAAVKHTYTPTVMTALEDQSGNAPTVYAQALGGLRTKITIPDLAELRTRKLAINKAQLVIYTDVEAIGNNFFQPAPRLTLYRQDLAARRQPVPDGDTRINSSQQFTGDPRSLEYRSGFSGGFGGRYDKENKRYVINLTSFVQDLLLDKIKDDAMYISPILDQETYNIPYLPTVSTGSQAILAGPGNTAEGGKYKMKLNIFYTELK